MCIRSLAYICKINKILNNLSSSLMSVGFYRDIDHEMKWMNESAMILSAFENRLRAGLV